MIQFRRADARFAQILQLDCCLHSRLIVIFRLRGFRQVDCCHHVCSICQFFAKNLILKVCIRYLDATQVAWIIFFAWLLRTAILHGTDFSNCGMGPRHQQQSTFLLHTSCDIYWKKPPLGYPVERLLSYTAGNKQKWLLFARRVSPRRS